jgi:hypothetical protein
VKFREETEREVKWREQRRGARMNSRALIEIEWEEPQGPPGRAEGYTRVVSRTGCLAIATQDLPLEQHVRVTNLANHLTTPAIVVWKGRQCADGWEIGLEFRSVGEHAAPAAEEDFWGVGL